MRQEWLEGSEWGEHSEVAGTRRGRMHKQRSEISNLKFESSTRTGDQAAPSDEAFAAILQCFAGVRSDLADTWMDLTVCKAVFSMEHTTRGGLMHSFISPSSSKLTRWCIRVHN
jgi:hypothetical protein